LGKDNAPSTSAPLVTVAEVPTLLRSMSGALAVMEALEVSITQRALPEMAELRQAALTSALVHTNALIRDLFQRHLPPNERRAALGVDFAPSTVLDLKGDASRGQELFAGVAQCSNCHLRDGRGRPFGPDLTEIGKKYPRPQLLEQILRPSQQIAPEFRLVSLVLANGDDLSGFVVRRTSDRVFLKDSQLVEHDLPVAEIRESRDLELSAMPEGLLATLTAQEAADLLAYLATAPGD
jgi:putative heme-binding domain-containing protein